MAAVRTSCYYVRKRYTKRVPVPIEARDPALDGALRMVKRGSENLVHGVYVAGCEVVRDGVPLPALGATACGDVLTPHVTVSNVHEVQARQRNRIDDATIDHPFRDYWDVFVLKHQHPANVAFHCAGVVMLYGAWVGPFRDRVVWWWITLVPLSQITGVLGHALFERSHIDVRDAVFSWRAIHGLNRMFVAVVSGGYGREIGRGARALRSLFTDAFNDESAGDSSCLRGARHAGRVTRLSSRSIWVAARGGSARASLLQPTGAR